MYEMMNDKKCSETIQEMEDLNIVKEKVQKSIVGMLTSIDDVQALERIHRFIEYIYTGK